MKKYYLTNSENLQINFFLPFCVVLKKCIALSMSWWIWQGCQYFFNGFFKGLLRRSITVKLLGVTWDFKSLIEYICCKANNKIRALFRVSQFLTLAQVKILADTYVLSYFRYCLIIWMFSGKCSNGLIVKSHYRCSRSNFNTQTGTYRYFLFVNGKTNIHKQNI